MHWEQTQFVRAVRQVFPAFFHDVSVLEIGSYDVNGSIRSFFHPARYVGVDLIAGAGVDVVCPGQTVRFPQLFDVAISTECFEHNPFYLETFLNMVRHVRPGGMILFTCASTGRPEHGTRRCDPASSPGTLEQGGDYYRNLVEDDFAQLDLPAVFAEHGFYANRSAHDLYFVGITRDRARMASLGALIAEVEQLSGEDERCFAMLRAGEVEASLTRMQALLDGASTLTRPHVLARQAWLLSSAGQGEAAVAAVRQALTLSESADLCWQLATILHGLKRLPEAVEAARSAATLAPSNAQFNYLLGALLQGAGRLDEAEAFLDKAVLLNPHLAPAFLQTSMLRIRQGRWHDAREAAERATALAPGDETIATHLARLLARDGAENRDRLDPAGGIP